MNRTAKWLYCIYVLALAGLAFNQTRPVNMAKPPAQSSSPWVAVSAEPPGTNNIALTITSPTALPNGAVGTAYSFSFDATGGLTPYSWSVSSGALPAGLNLGSSGSLTGTPTVAGQFAFTLSVVDSTKAPASQSASKNFTLRIGSALAVTTTSPINATAGSSLTIILAATGGAPLYLWFVAPGSQLPPGLTLDASSGFLSGTPTTVGTYNFTVIVTDSASTPASASKALVLIVAPALVITTATSPPSGAAGT